jgi:hypothetical protein
MEEVIGSIPIRSAKLVFQVSLKFPASLPRPVWPKGLDKSAGDTVRAGLSLI